MGNLKEKALAISRKHPFSGETAAPKWLAEREAGLTPAGHPPNRQLEDFLELLNTGVHLDESRLPF